MKKILLPLFIAVISIISLFPTLNLSAASSYKSTLSISKNSHVEGIYRWYDTGTFQVQVDIDAYNGDTTGCEKLMWITLHYSPVRQDAGKMINTTLYTCQYATMGKFNNGQYFYVFSTAYSDGRVFCGIKSNNVVMSSK